MADFLTAVSTKKTVRKSVVEEIQTLSIQDAIIVDSPQAALRALKSQPNYETLNSVLKFLRGPSISLVISEPVYASIAYELVSNTLPNYWTTLKQHSKNAHAFASILWNPTGIGHLLTRLRSLIADSQQKKAPGTAHNVSDFIKDTLDVLDRVIDGDDAISSVWRDIRKFSRSDIQRKLTWKEYLAQVASGRVLSMRAEAEDILKANGVECSALTGNDFATWLGRNFVHMSTGDDNEDHIAALVELLSKILGLGYTGEFFRSFLVPLIDRLARSIHCYRPRHCDRAGSNSSHR
jgi:telomere length regulation protein